MTRSGGICIEFNIDDSESLRPFESDQIEVFVTRSGGICIESGHSILPMASKIILGANIFQTMRCRRRTVAENRAAKSRSAVSRAYLKIKDYYYQQWIAHQAEKRT